MNAARDTVRWGILSTGRIAHQFAHDMRWVENGVLQAVASRSRDTAEAFASKYGIPRAHGRYDELLADPEVDAVYVATPHTLHHQNTLDALAAGKHVLCEKPCTVTPAQSEDLFERAAQSNRFVMEAMWTWFLPAIRKARQWVESGRIGRLRQIKADFGYPLLPFDAGRREYDSELAGGCLLEMGIYPVALARLFTNADSSQLQVLARFAPNGVEDEVTWLASYGDDEDGITATLGTSFRSKLQNWAYLIGEESYIAIPDFWRAHRCLLYRLDALVDTFDDGRDSLGLNYEMESAGKDILAGRRQSTVVPWSATLAFQREMARIRADF